MAAVDPINNFQSSKWNPHKPCIPFTIYTRLEDYSYVRKYLLLDCADRDLVGRLIDTLYTRKIGADGKAFLEPKYKRALLAGDWKIAGQNICTKSCARCDGETIYKGCHGAIVTEYKTHKQVYGISNDGFKTTVSVALDDKHDVL